MTALVKYKNQVEYSFQTWMKNHPESTHWADKDRFLKFTKNVCTYNAKRWKDPEFLKQRILKMKPNFDNNRLVNLTIAFEYMVEFHKTSALPRVWQIEADVEAKNGYYIERGFKNGNFYDKELPCN